MDKEIITSNSELDTISAGYNFARKLKAGEIVLFFGELGAGKTEFTKGIIEFFEIDEIVTSPTFTIINQYFSDTDGFFSIFHIDLYRIKEGKELYEIGFEDILNDPNSIKLIEWPDNGNYRYSDSIYKIVIETDIEDANKRIITISK